MIACVLLPAFAAAVASPARRLWPLNCAASSRRRRALHDLGDGVAGERPRADVAVLDLARASALG
jgi:hypothetical protein